MPLLPPENNFADLKEMTANLASSTPDDDLKRLALIVGTLATRCDLLERQVERLERSSGQT